MKDGACQRELYDAILLCMKNYRKLMVQDIQGSIIHTLFLIRGAKLTLANCHSTIPSSKLPDGYETEPDGRGRTDGNGLGFAMRQPPSRNCWTVAAAAAAAGARPTKA